MKYTKPSFEIIEVETIDIITASLNQGEGSITANGVTISGKSDEFAVDFSDLLGNGF